MIKKSIKKHMVIATLKRHIEIMFEDTQFYLVADSPDIHNICDETGEYFGVDFDEVITLTDLETASWTDGVSFCLSHNEEDVENSETWNQTTKDYMKLHTIIKEYRITNQ